MNHRSNSRAPPEIEQFGSYFGWNSYSPPKSLAHSPVSSPAFPISCIGELMNSESERIGLAVLIGPSHLLTSLRLPSPAYSHPPITFVLDQSSRAKLVDIVSSNLFTNNNNNNNNNSQFSLCRIDSNLGDQFGYFGLVSPLSPFDYFQEFQMNPRSRLLISDGSITPAPITANISDYIPTTESLLLTLTDDQLRQLDHLQRTTFHSSSIAYMNHEQLGQVLVATSLRPDAQSISFLTSYFSEQNAIFIFNWLLGQPSKPVLTSKNPSEERFLESKEQLKIEVITEDQKKYEGFSCFKQLNAWFTFKSLHSQPSNSSIIHLSSGTVTHTIQNRLLAQSPNSEFNEAVSDIVAEGYLAIALIGRVATLFNWKDFQVYHRLELQQSQASKIVKKSERYEYFIGDYSGNITSIRLNWKSMRLELESNSANEIPAKSMENPQGHVGRINQMHVIAEKHQLMVASKDGVRVWDINPNKKKASAVIVLVLEGESKKPVTFLGHSKARFYVAGEDSVLRVYENSGKMIRSVSFANPIKCGVFLNSVELALSEGNRIKIINVITSESESLEYTSTSDFPAQIEHIIRVSHSQFITADSIGCVRRWRIKQQSELEEEEEKEEQRVVGQSQEQHVNQDEHEYLEYKSKDSLAFSVNHNSRGYLSKNFLSSASPLKLDPFFNSNQQSEKLVNNTAISTTTFETKKLPTSSVSVVKHTTPDTRPIQQKFQGLSSAEKRLEQIYEQENFELKQKILDLEQQALLTRIQMIDPLGQTPVQLTSTRSNNNNPNEIETLHRQERLIVEMELKLLQQESQINQLKRSSSSRSPSTDQKSRIPSSSLAVAATQSQQQLNNQSRTKSTSKDFEAELIPVMEKEITQLRHELSHLSSAIQSKKPLLAVTQPSTLLLSSSWQQSKQQGKSLGVSHNRTKSLLQHSQNQLDVQQQQLYSLQPQLFQEEQQQYDSIEIGQTDEDIVRQLTLHIDQTISNSQSQMHAASQQQSQQAMSLTKSSKANYIVQDIPPLQTQKSLTQQTQQSHLPVNLSIRPPNMQSQVQNSQQTVLQQQQQQRNMSPLIFISKPMSQNYSIDPSNAPISTREQQQLLSNRSNGGSAAQALQASDAIDSGRQLSSEEGNNNSQIQSQSTPLQLTARSQQQQQQQLTALTQSQQFNSSPQKLPVTPVVLPDQQKLAEIQKQYTKLEEQIKTLQHNFQQVIPVSQQQQHQLSASSRNQISSQQGVPMFAPVLSPNQSQRVPPTAQQQQSQIGMSTTTIKPQNKLRQLTLTTLPSPRNIGKPSFHQVVQQAQQQQQLQPPSRSNHFQNSSTPTAPVPVQAAATSPAPIETSRSIRQLINSPFNQSITETAAAAAAAAPATTTHNRKQSESQIISVNQSTHSRSPPPTNRIYIQHSPLNQQIQSQIITPPQLMQQSLISSQQIQPAPVGTPTLFQSSTQQPQATHPLVTSGVQLLQRTHSAMSLSSNQQQQRLSGSSIILAPSIQETAQLQQQIKQLQQQVQQSQQSEDMLKRELLSQAQLIQQMQTVIHSQFDEIQQQKQELEVMKGDNLALNNSSNQSAKEFQEIVTKLQQQIVILTDQSKQSEKELESALASAQFAATAAATATATAAAASATSSAHGSQGNNGNNSLTSQPQATSAGNLLITHLRDELERVSKESNRLSAENRQQSLALIRAEQNLSEARQSLLQVESLRVAALQSKNEKDLMSSRINQLESENSMVNAKLITFKEEIHKKYAAGIAAFQKLLQQHTSTLPVSSTSSALSQRNYSENKINNNNNNEELTKSFEALKGNTLSSMDIHALDKLIEISSKRTSQRAQQLSNSQKQKSVIASSQNATQLAQARSISSNSINNNNNRIVTEPQMTSNVSLSSPLRSLYRQSSPPQTIQTNNHQYSAMQVSQQQTQPLYQQLIPSQQIFVQSLSQGSLILPQIQQQQQQQQLSYRNSSRGIQIIDSPPQQVLLSSSPKNVQVSPTSQVIIPQNQVVMRNSAITHIQDSRVASQLVGATINPELQGSKQQSHPISIMETYIVPKQDYRVSYTQQQGGLQNSSNENQIKDVSESLMGSTTKRSGSYVLRDKNDVKVNNTVSFQEDNQKKKKQDIFQIKGYDSQLIQEGDSIHSFNPNNLSKQNTLLSSILSNSNEKQQQQNSFEQSDSKFYTPLPRSKSTNERTLATSTNKTPNKKEESMCNIQ